MCESKDCLFLANLTDRTISTLQTSLLLRRAAYHAANSAKRLQATCVDCTAWKFTEFHACHTCHLVSSYQPPDDTKNMLKTHPHARHQSARDDFLVAKVKMGILWEDLKKEAATVMDRDKYMSIRKRKPLLEPEIAYKQLRTCKTPSSMTDISYIHWPART